MIEKAGFGELLKIGTSTLPVELINWLLRNFDAKSSQLMIPGRGTINVTSESVHRILSLPKNGDKVLYLDSLVVDNVLIPDCLPRVGAWKKALIDKVIKFDTKKWWLWTTKTQAIG